MTYQCERVGSDYPERAAVTVTVEEEIPATPERIFEIWEDAEAWTHWVDVIQKMTWTSDPPFEVGTTRRAELMGGFVGDEEFVEWDRPKRMAFRFNSTSQAVLDGFLEQYEVIDLGDGTSAVRWTMSMTPRGAAKYSMKLAAPLMPWFLRRTLRQLGAYAKENPGES